MTVRGRATYKRLGMRRLLLQASVVVGLVLVAWGAGAKPAPQLTAIAAARPNVHVIAAHRKRAATRAAERLLSEFVLPTRARRIAQPHGYGGVIRQSGPEPPAELVDANRFWSVRKPLVGVVDFVTAHQPRGFRSSGPTYGPRAPRYATWSFVSPAGKHTVPSRFLDVTAVRLHGRTVLRVDAKVVWIYPRSPSERVPSRVREIVIRAPKVSRKVTNPADVGRIVRWFDALPISPPGVAMLCPLVPGAGITISFDTARGALLAQAKAPPTPAWVCTQIEFTTGRHSQRPLIDRSMSRRASFVGRLQRVLGVRLLLRYR